MLSQQIQALLDADGRSVDWYYLTKIAVADSRIEDWATEILNFTTPEFKKVLPEDSPPSVSDIKSIPWVKEANDKEFGACGMATE